MRPQHAWIAALLLLAGCGTPPDEGCVAGVEHACACDGAGAGVKVCGEDGVFGECDCSATCAPTTCEAEQVACGPLDDGCGTTLDCGACPTDACAEQRDDCDEHATCTPDGESFTCACDEGYLGDGKSCAPDRDTYVADLGQSEVEVTIQGVGVLHVGQLSKISIRIPMTRVPIGPRDQPFPSGVELPPVTIGEVRGTAAEVVALQNWIATGTAKSVTVRLLGLGGEVTEIASASVTPSALDDTVTTQGNDRVLGSLQLLPAARWAVTERITMVDTFWPRPRPGTEVEIMGITRPEGCEFPEGVVTMALTDTQLVLPGCADADTLITWTEGVLDLYDAHETYYDWRSLSVIDRDGDGNEFHRHNAFEAVPTELIFFDPTRPYGTSLLTTLILELGLVEEA